MFIIIYVICGYGIAFAHIYCAENCSLYEHNYLLWGIAVLQLLGYIYYIYYGIYLLWGIFSMGIAVLQLLGSWEVTCVYN